MSGEPGDGGMLQATSRVLGEAETYNIQSEAQVMMSTSVYTCTIHVY